MAISLNMLSGSATAYKITSIDADRNPVFSAGVELSRIYTVFNHGVSNGSNGKEPASSATLYYDVLNSRPLNYQFEKGQKIVIDNESYTVMKINPFYNAAGLRHYEVDLI